MKPPICVILICEYRNITPDLNFDTTNHHQIAFSVLAEDPFDGYKLQISISSRITIAVISHTGSAQLRPFHRISTPIALFIHMGVAKLDCLQWRKEHVQQASQGRDGMVLGHFGQNGMEDHCTVLQPLSNKLFRRGVQRHLVTDYYPIAHTSS